MKEKNKISLLRDIDQIIKINKRENCSKENVIDERIELEKNKVMATAYNMLICILVIFSILAECIKLTIDTSYIFGIIGIISYIMLLKLCKEMAVKGNSEMLGLFIWSFITLPASVFNIVSDFIYREDVLDKLGWFALIIPIIVIIGVIMLMYQIANAIYRKTNE